MRTKLITGIALIIFVIVFVGIVGMSLTSKKSASDNSSLIVNNAEKQKVEQKNLTLTTIKKPVANVTTSPVTNPPSAYPPVRTTGAS